MLLLIINSRLLSAGFATHPSLLQQSPAGHTGVMSLAQCNIAAGTQTQPACRQPSEDLSRADQVEVEQHRRQEQWGKPKQRLAAIVPLTTAVAATGTKAADNWRADSADAQLAPGGADAADLEETITKGASMFSFTLHPYRAAWSCKPYSKGCPSLSVQGMQMPWLLLCLSHLREFHCSLPLATRTVRIHLP